MLYSRYSVMPILMVLLVIILPWRTIREARAASQPSKAALPAATCPLAALSTWTPQETWVWSQVCRGKEADFNTALDYGEKLSPKELKGWQSKRVLRSIFLEALLLDEPFRNVLPRQGVHIIGAWFQEPLDLAYATLVHRLAIEGSRFEADVDLTALRTSAIVDLSGSTVLGALHMPGLHTRSVLYMGKEATFPTINFVDANVDGRIDLSTATVTGHLDMNGLHVGGVLFMNDKATFATVDLSKAQVDGVLDLSTATVTGELNMHNLHVGSDVFMYDATIGQAVKLLFATIGSGLDLGGAALPSLDLTETRISGELNLVPGKLSAESPSKAHWILRNTEVGGVQDTRTAWPKTLTLDGLRIGAWGAGRWRIQTLCPRVR